MIRDYDPDLGRPCPSRVHPDYDPTSAGIPPGAWMACEWPEKSPDTHMLICPEICFKCLLVEVAIVRQDPGDWVLLSENFREQVGHTGSPVVEAWEFLEMSLGFHDDHPGVVHIRNEIRSWSKS